VPSEHSSVSPPPSAESAGGADDSFLAPFDVFIRAELLELALTHRSWAYENGSATNNERLEFLGDSILGQAVTVMLYQGYPNLAEGELARRRAALVSTVALAEVARVINLGPQLRLGVGEERTGGRHKESILADAVEAIIGAVFLSTNSETADAFVRQLVAPLLADPERFTVSLDPKTSLQEAATERGLPQPQYRLTSTGPDHDRRFTATVQLDDIVGTGVGTSKKAAELAAAREIMAELQRRRPALPAPKG
jgi:ribonuclease-3